MLARQRRATRPQVKMIGLVINIKVKRRPSDQSYSNGWSLKIDWPPTVLTEPTLYTRHALHSTYCTKYNNCLFPFWLPPKCFKLDFKLTRCPNTLPLSWPNSCFRAQKCTWPPRFQCTEVHTVHNSPCFSAHFQPDVARLARQHGAWTEAHRLHAEGPLRQGAPRAQGPRRTLALEAHS